jgi:hypothetical protein
MNQGEKTQKEIQRVSDNTPGGKGVQTTIKKISMLASAFRNSRLQKNTTGKR